MHQCCCAGHVEGLLVLLEAGADVNLLQYSQSPLFTASDALQEACVRVLLDAGADATVPDGEELTALVIAVCSIVDGMDAEMHVTPDVVRGQQPTLCLETLLEGGGDVRTDATVRRIALHS